MEIFHALYENCFGSDLHSFFFADDENQAKEKIKFRSKGSKVEILNDENFKQKFPSGIKFMVAYYEKVGGEKFCLIATSSGTEEETNKIFQQKFAGMQTKKIETYEQFKAAKEEKKQQAQEKTTATATIIRRCGISARPYAMA